MKDVLVAMLVGGLIAFWTVRAQGSIDDQRAVRDHQIAQEQADRSDRLENLRFVRDRSSPDPTTSRPFVSLDLAGQDLAGLQLRGANFDLADLRLSSLRRTDFSPGAQPAQANAGEPPNTVSSPSSFEAVNFCGADLNGAALPSANLRGADLRLASVDWTNFSNAGLAGADLGGVRAFRPNFENADLLNADLSNGIFIEANFRGADLSGANFYGTSLASADFTGAIISPSTAFNGASYDEATIWPEKFRPGFPASIPTGSVGLGGPYTYEDPGIGDARCPKGPKWKFGW